MFTRIPSFSSPAARCTALAVPVGLLAAAACPSKRTPFLLDFRNSGAMKLHEGRIKHKAKERLRYKSCFPVSSSCVCVLLFNRTIAFYF